MYSERSPLATSYDSIEDLLDELQHFNSQAGRDEEIVKIKTSKGEYRL